jgi:hypothetical protein
MPAGTDSGHDLSIPVVCAAQSKDPDREQWSNTGIHCLAATIASEPRGLLAIDSRQQRCVRRALLLSHPFRRGCESMPVPILSW